MTKQYGEFELTIGVPNDYDGHRCEYAREYIADHLGEKLVDALVIQATIPTKPPGTDGDGKDYYRVGGNLNVDRVGDDDD